MATFRREVYSIAKFVRWNEENELILQPKFQRRLSWSQDARAYLIDTILRGLPMPKVYIRRNFSEEKKHNVYEVVDGQQRLDAILAFRKNGFRLSNKFSLEFGPVFFEQLSDGLQRRFIEYEISTEVMEDAVDREVWAMFERLNTYTLTLNRQERRNARFFGYFKQTAYRLATEQTELKSWSTLKLLGNQQIARMREVELISDIITAIVKGIQDITYITKIYQEFDDEFPRQERASVILRNVMSYLTVELSNIVSSTKFRNLAWFYSLAIAVADAVYGIPNGHGQKELLTRNVIGDRMELLSSAMQVPELPEGLARLKDALSRATSQVPKRLIRHEHFYNMLTLDTSSWNQLWSVLTRD